MARKIPIVHPTVRQLAADPRFVAAVCGPTYVTNQELVRTFGAKGRSAVAAARKLVLADPANRQKAESARRRAIEFDALREKLAKVMG